MHEDLPWTRPHVAEELLGGVRANFAAKVRHDVVEFAMRTTKAARAAFVSEQPAALAAIAADASIGIDDYSVHFKQIRHPFGLRTRDPLHFGQERSRAFLRQRARAFAFQQVRQFLMSAFSSCDRTRFSPHNSWPRRQCVCALVAHINEPVLSLLPGRRASVAAKGASRRSLVSNTAQQRRHGTACSSDFRQTQQPPLRSQTTLAAFRTRGGNGFGNSSFPVGIFYLRRFSRLHLLVGILDGLATDKCFTGIARVQIITFEITAI